MLRDGTEQVKESSPLEGAFNPLLPGGNEPHQKVLEYIEASGAFPQTPAPPSPRAMCNAQPAPGKGLVFALLRESDPLRFA